MHAPWILTSQTPYTCCLAPLHPSAAGPFSHRVLLTLEEKGVPYSVTFVDVKNKPAWWVGGGRGGAGERGGLWGTHLTRAGRQG